MAESFWQQYLSWWGMASLLRLAITSPSVSFSSPLIEHVFPHSRLCGLSLCPVSMLYINQRKFLCSLHTRGAHGTLRGSHLPHLLCRAFVYSRCASHNIQVCNSISVFLSFFELLLLQQLSLVSFIDVSLILPVNLEVLGLLLIFMPGAWQARKASRCIAGRGSCRCMADVAALYICCCLGRYWLPFCLICEVSVRLSMLYTGKWFFKCFFFQVLLKCIRLCGISWARIPWVQKSCKEVGAMIDIIIIIIICNFYSLNGYNEFLNVSCQRSPVACGLCPYLLPKFEYWYVFFPITGLFCSDRRWRAITSWMVGSHTLSFSYSPEQLRSG